MAQILVRKIDDNTFERLRILARDRGMPVEALARDALEDAARQRTAEEARAWLSRLDELRAMTPIAGIDSVPILRGLRDGDAADD